MLDRIHATVGLLACAGLLGCGDGRTTGNDAGEDAAAATGLGTEGDSESSKDEGSTDAGAGDASARLDVGDGQGSTGGDGQNTCNGREGSDGSIDFSFLWAANFQQTTLSKINTRTLAEEGRYLTSPRVRTPEDRLGGDPSRTSVGLSGDVIVANRSGGLTKFYARMDDCEESNGIAGIQTSSGANNVLPWGADECMAWHADTGFVVQRPVSWTSGVFNPVTCRWDNAMVWTTGNKPGAGGEGSEVVTVQRLRGDDGSVDAEIELPDVQIHRFGPYGGAADGDGNFWFFQDAAFPGEVETLFRVDAETLAYEHWGIPEAHWAYGITVDEDGRPWIAGRGVMRFNPGDETWSHAPLENGMTGTGIMTGHDRQIWAQLYREGERYILGFDLDTMEPIRDFGPFENGGKGVSVDFDGYVWNVGGQHALRIDPDTGAAQTYAGLAGAYTYSDMTGWGLRSANGLPPPAG